MSVSPGKMKGKGVFRPFDGCNVAVSSHNQIVTFRTESKHNVCIKLEMFSLVVFNARMSVIKTVKGSNYTLYENLC